MQTAYIILAWGARRPHYGFYAVFCRSGRSGPVCCLRWR